jgi:hypothetical protein
MRLGWKEPSSDTPNTWFGPQIPAEFRHKPLLVQKGRRLEKELGIDLPEIS